MLGSSIFWCFFFFLQCLTAASDGSRQREATEASPSYIAVFMLDLTMGYLVAQEYMDSWILATAKFMFLSLESEALDPEDLGARWSSIGNQGLKSFSSGSFQPALAVFLLSLPVFFLNWLLSNHSLSSSAVIVLCKNLGCQSIYAGVMMCLGHLLMLGSQCCSETGHASWFRSFRDGDLITESRILADL